MSRRFIASSVKLALLVIGLWLLTECTTAGVVVLELENLSGQPIHDVQVQYGRGSVSVSSVTEGEIFEKSLGRIGEGAKFDVTWINADRSLRTAQSSIYFYAHLGYDNVRIRFLRDGKAEFLHEGQRL